MPQDNCGTCYARRKESGGQSEPACWQRLCSVAHMMNPGFEPWLIVFAVLSDEMIANNGLGRDALLDLGHGWTDFETLLVLKRMHHVWAQAQAEKREEQQRKKSGGMGGVAGMGRKRR